MLATLFTLSLPNYAGQFLLGFVLEASSIRQDIGLSDLKYGIISGPAFLLPYGFAHLFMGRLTDRLKRPEQLLIFCSFGTSLFLCVSSMANGFWSLLCPHILFSLCSAGINNTGYFLVGNYFKHDQRALAVSLYLLALFAGFALASLSVPLCLLVNWRLVFLLFGGIGALFTLASCCWLNRWHREKSALSYPGELRHDIKQLWKNRTLLLVTVISAIRGAVGFAKAMFTPLAYYVLYPEWYSVFGVMYGVILVLAPIPGYLFTALLTDKYEKTSPHIRPAIVAACLFLSGVVYPFVLNWGVFWLSLFGEFVFFLVGEIYMPQGTVMILNVTTPRVRALQTGLNLFFSMTSSSVLSLLLGYAKQFEGDEQFLTILVVFVTGGCLICAALQCQLIWIYPQDLKVDSDENEELMELSENLL